MKARRIFGLFSLTLVTAVIAVMIYAKLFQPQTAYIEVEPQPAALEASYTAPAVALTSMDFVDAAENSVHSVVHVMTKSVSRQQVNPLYEFFFGITPEQQQRPVMGFGSGVIISTDGYIVTNNHVIEGSDEIEVIMNDRREFTAELVGRDPSTDLALLKIDEKDLPALDYGNSDDLKLGEWVLAVGNPYNLTSTVTAGIVSAKARDINILRSDFPIESFIQTDAAVNPGNSGGALVNTSGELIGINTAIASRTGTYTGYSFAIPVSIVKKVVEDLREFGEVQRALLGVTIRDISSELAEEENLSDTKGVYISETSDNGAARAAGIRKGDVVLSINGVKVNSASELQEQISKFRPKDEVTVKVKRDKETKLFDVVLRNMQGNTEIVRSNEIIEVLGARFEELSTAEKRSMGIGHGIRVSNIEHGKFMQIGIKKGFVVTAINKKPVNSVRDIADVLRDAEGGVIVEGMARDGSKAYYAFGM